MLVLKSMSCIAHVCSCLFEKRLANSASDFENEYFINVGKVDRILSHIQRMTAEYSDFFVGKFRDIITLYDGNSHFLTCTKYLLNYLKLMVCF